MKLTQRLKPYFYSDIERQLEVIFNDVLFAPIIEILRSQKAIETVSEALHSTSNTDALRAAMRSGRVQYSNGAFSGRFSVSISLAIKALGGKYDADQKIYRLPPSSVPPALRAEAETYNLKAETTHKLITSVIDGIAARLDAEMDKKDIDAGGMAQKIVSDFRPIAKAIEVTPEITKDSHVELGRRYTENMKLWIKSFAKEEIVKLRETVEDNAMQGYRYDNLVRRIQNRYGVAKQKAVFLARQETALFMSEYRERRFSEVGVVAYVWRTSHDGRVRPDHKRLNGKRFRYDQPPVTDATTQKRNNPGRDFNCRCVDEPIIPVMSESR